MKRIIITSVILGSFLISGNSQTGNNPKLGKDPVKKVVAAMTLEEKAALVVGTGMRMPGGPPPSANAKPPANPTCKSTFRPCYWPNSESGCRSSWVLLLTSSAGYFSDGSC